METFWKRKSYSVVYLTFLVGVCLGDEQGPVFIYEPPHDVTFLNTRGVTIDCSAHGDPHASVSWINTNGQLVNDVYGLRSLYRNGSLRFHEFSSSRYRQGVHDMVYRCRATNIHGTIVSRDVRVRAAVEQAYQVQVYDDYVISGNTGVLRCHIPSYVKDYVSVTSWLREDGFQIDQKTDSDKYILLPSGVLYVTNAGRKDGQLSFSCQTKHKLTGSKMLSHTSGSLIITDPRNSVRARITNYELVIEGYSGGKVYVPCAAQGFPLPAYKWFYKDNQTTEEISLNDRMKQMSGVLVIREARVDDSRTYVCLADNGVGDQKITTKVVIRERLSVYIDPQKISVDSGKPVEFRCVLTGNPISSIRWLKDGRTFEIPSSDGRILFPSPVILRIVKVRRKDQGMYQCLAKNGIDSAQGTAQLILGDVSPMLSQTFVGKTFHPEADMSLRCTAIGNPRPDFRWYLDDRPIRNIQRRTRYNENVLVDGSVVSELTVKDIRPEDGGHYTCKASNKAGHAEHTAKVNVYGPPVVRKMTNISVVAGEDMRINCYVYGHPVSKIRWTKDDIELRSSRRYRIFENGTLIVKDTESMRDEGRYTCIAENRQRQSSKQSVWAKLIVKPILQDITDKDVKEETRVTLMCSLSEGEQPITFTWLKDDEHLPPSLGISETKLPMMSVLDIPMVHFVHVGNYTCVASNQGGEDRKTASVRVLVQPSWIQKPTDSVGVVGHFLQLGCAASGHPSPEITWHTKNDNNTWSRITESERITVHSNGSLMFLKALKTDEGEYLCQANNDVGRPMKTYAKIRVGEVPSISTKTRRMLTKIGESVELTCSIAGDRPYNTTWTKMAQPPQPLDNHRYQVIERRSTSILKIDPVDASDSLTFRCEVRNRYGGSDGTIQLIVRQPPGAPNNLIISEDSTRSIRLAWTAPFTGHSRITKYIIQLRRKNEEQWNSRGANITVQGFFTTTVITQIVSDVKYSLRMFSVNLIGIGDPSAVIEFNVLKNGTIIVSETGKISDNRLSSSSHLMEYSLLSVGIVCFVIFVCVATILLCRCRKRRNIKEKQDSNVKASSPDIISTSNKITEDNNGGYYGDIHSSETQILASSRHSFISTKHDYYAASSSVGNYTEVSPYATFHINDSKKPQDGCQVELSTFTSRHSVEIS